MFKLGFQNNEPAGVPFFELGNYFELLYKSNLRKSKPHKSDPLKSILSRLSFMLVCFSIISLFANQTIANQTYSGLQAQEQSNLDSQTADAGLAESDGGNPVIGSQDTNSDDEPTENWVQQRIVEEQIAMLSPFTILPHKPNYFSPYSRTFRTLDPSNYIDDTLEQAIPAEVRDDITFDNIEFEFQLSLKTPIALGVLFEDDILMGAYTHKSWWQAYNGKASAPFRETNHEPELVYFVPTRFDIFGMRHEFFGFSFNHQSNGQYGSQSRSWNRLIFNNVMSAGNFYFSVSPWYRIPEETSNDPFDPSDDDNPDLEDYMGHGEMTLVWKPSQHTISAVSRQNFHTKKGSIELMFSKPKPLGLTGRVFVKFFAGYGESLIDYNRYLTRLTVGFMLTDWL